MTGMWQDAWADDVLDRAIKSSRGLAYVWDDGSVRAFVCAHDVGFRGYLSVLVVEKDVRRKGIGRELKVAKIWVLTNKSNSTAVNLYRSTGAKKVGDDDVLLVYESGSFS